MFLLYFVTFAKGNMDVLEALKTRRTIRQYNDTYAIPKEILQEIVDAGLDSPTARDLQAINLVVVTNREKIDEITKVSYDSWPEERQKVFDARIDDLGIKNTISGDASCIVFLIQDKEKANPLFIGVDAGIMTMAMMTAARRFDLHTMCLGCLLWGDKAGVEKKLGVPDDSLIMALAIGKARDGPIVIRDKTRKCSASWIE